MNANRPVVTVVAQCVQDLVLVSATHPTLGPLYWSYADGSDHNAPNCYSLTTRADEALTLRKGWREGIMAWHHRDHMTKLFDDDEQFEQFNDLDETLDGSWATATHLYGMLALLQERSGQDVEVFAQWLAAAVWLDVPAGPIDRLEAYDVPQFQPGVSMLHCHG